MEEGRRWSGLELTATYKLVISYVVRLSEAGSDNSPTRPLVGCFRRPLLRLLPAVPADARRARWVSLVVG